MCITNRFTRDSHECLKLISLLGAEKENVTFRLNKKVHKIHKTQIRNLNLLCKLRAVSCLTFTRRRNLHHQDFLRSEFEKSIKAVSDFFGPNSIDDGVDGCREQNVHESHEGVDVRWYGDVQVVREECDAAYQVETHHDHQMSPAGVKRLPAVLAGSGRLQDDAQDLHIGEEDEGYVYAYEADDHSEASCATAVGAAAGQADQRHVVAVAVLDDVRPTEPQRSRQTHQRRHDGAAADQSEEQQLHKHGGVNDFGVA